MIRNAVGTVIRRMIVTATTNRTIGMLAARRSTICAPSRAMTTISGMVSASSSGTAVNTTFPGSVSRFHPLEITVMQRTPQRVALGGSLIHAPHDGIQRGHDGHGVGDEV